MTERPEISPELEVQVELPSLFRLADIASVRAQRLHWTLTALQLGLLIIAAASALIELRTTSESTDYAAVIGAGAFIMAALVQVFSFSTGAEQKWYEARALAESAKTLAIRYAVAGEPFARDLPPAEADQHLASLYFELLNERSKILDVSRVGITQEITEWMRESRKSPLDARQAIYRRHRLHDQREFYASRARAHAKRATLWNGIVLGAEVAGALGAVLRAAGVVEFDLLGLAAAFSAGAAAWLEARQHKRLTTSYSRVFHELSLTEDLIVYVDDEAEWASFVDDTEDLISREHTSWLASRSTH